MRLLLELTLPILDELAELGQFTHDFAASIEGIVVPNAAYFAARNPLV